MPIRPGGNLKGFKEMEQCKECDLAIYCYSDYCSWTFRTKQEMEEKTEAIKQCPIREEIEQMKEARKKQVAG